MTCGVRRNARARAAGIVPNNDTMADVPDAAAASAAPDDGADGIPTKELDRKDHPLRRLGITKSQDLNKDGVVEWWELTPDQRQRIALQYGGQTVFDDGIDVVVKLVMAAFVFMASMALNSAFSAEFAPLRGRGKWLWAAVSTSLVVIVALFLVGYQCSKQRRIAERVAAQLHLSHVSARQLAQYAGAGVTATRQFAF